MNGRIIGLESCDEKLSCRRIKRQENGRHPVGYVGYSVFKVSDVMKEIQS